MNKKSVIVLFGTKTSLEKFEESQIVGKVDDPLYLTIDNLSDQVKFILDEPTLNKNKNMILKVEGFNVEDFDYIVDEIRDFKNLMVKFIVVEEDVVNTEMKESMSELIDRVRSISKKIFKSENPNDYIKNPDELMMELTKFDDVDFLGANLENIEYLIHTIHRAYGVNDITSGKIPKNLCDDVESLLRNITNKLSDTIKNDE